MRLHLGVFIGALQAITGVAMEGTERACQATGHPVCTYLIRPHRALS